MSVDIHKLETLIENLLAQEAAELVDLRYFQAGGSWTLRVYIDKHGGVTLDDCERFSDRIGAMLDATDFMTHSYALEVSSPGMDRVLKKEKDFERFSGHQVKILLKVPIEKRRRFTGFLRGFENGEVVLMNGEKAVRFELSIIEEARLDPEIKI